MVLIPANVAGAVVQSLVNGMQELEQEAPRGDGREQRRTSGNLSNREDFLGDGSLAVAE